MNSQLSIRSKLIPALFGLAMMLFGSQAEAQTINVLLTDTQNNPTMAFLNMTPSQHLGVNTWQGTAVDPALNTSQVVIAETATPGKFIYFTGNNGGTLPYPFGSIGVIDCNPDPDEWVDTTGQKGFAYLIIL